MAETKKNNVKYPGFEGIHEQIGNFEVKSEREKLVPQVPEELPEIYFDADGIDKEAVFAYEKTEWTEEKLEQEIAAQREYYMPFFAELAPEMQTQRTHKELKTFQWRVGTDEDARNFSDVLKGNGSWTTVDIPHFGEPLGVAVTYYRTEFELTAEELEKESQWICFKGIDYKAHVYINDALVGSHTGFFAPFEFEFTKQARVGTNVCVVVVENDFIPMGSNCEYRGKIYTGDKIYAQTGVGYDEPLAGWHHCPAGMGIWQDVFVEGRSNLFIHDIFVRPTAPEKAEIWVELFGTQVGLQEVTLDISVYGQNFKETVFEHMLHTPLKENGLEDPKVPLKMERGINYIKIPVDIPKARLWETTEPWLYQAQIRLIDEKSRVLDEQKRQFGMRFFTMDTDCSPKGVFKLNGRKIKFRGVNSQGREQRMVFLKDFDRLLKDYLLAKVGNINYLRITQRPVQPEVYDCCDKLGLLVQTDFPAFGLMQRSTITEALKQAQEMEHLIRSHPCCILSTYINEPYPNMFVKLNRSMTRQELETFFECADKMIHMLNPDRVIKPVDGDYNPPAPYGLPDYHCYTCWYNGHGVTMGMLYKGHWLPVKDDWNYGCGEFGMEGLDPVSLIKKYYPKEWLPENDDDTWTPAIIPGDPPPQLGHLHYMFYETPRTMAEWAEASQVYQALAMNIMTRAYRRNRKMVSFAYHLFIDAYPNGWMKAMVDFEGTPKKAFWEFKDACQPLMVDLRCDRFTAASGEKINVEAWVCNDIDEEITDAKLHYQVLLNNNMILAGKTDVNIPASDSTFQGYIPVQIPELEERGRMAVQIALIRKNGEILSSYEMVFNVFPNDEKELGKIFTVGAPGDFEAKLKKEFNVSFANKKEIDENTAILVFDMEQYATLEKDLLSIVEKGAKIIFFNLPTGSLQIAGNNIEVKACGRRPVNFVARNKEHYMVADFETNDVRYWYDEEEDMISPMLYETFDADGFDAILTSANKTDEVNKDKPQGVWEKALAVAEQSYGHGKIRICQIDLQHRFSTNPVAKILLERLINM